VKTISQIVAGGGWRGARRYRIKVKACVTLILAMFLGSLSMFSIESFFFYACIPAVISLISSGMLFIREKSIEIESLSGEVGTDPRNLYGTANPLSMR